MGKAAVPQRTGGAGGSKPAGAGGPEGDAAGMDRADLKRMLKFASQEPVQVAFALGGDGKAIILMDRRKPARSLEKDLKAAAPDSKNHRFGSASVDQEQPKLARFTVNKAAGGIARKLVVALKGTGFSKVEVGSEDGGAPERAEGDDEDAGHQAPDAPVGQAHGDAAAAAASGNGGASASQDAHGGGPAAPQSAPPHAARAPAALSNADLPNATPASPSQADATAASAAAVGIGAAAGAAAAANPPAAAGAPPDTGQLVAKLIPLVQRIQAASAKDPAQKASLHKLATDAQASLRRAMLTLARGDLDRAASDIELVRKGVEAAEKPPAQAGTAGTDGHQAASHGGKFGDGGADAAGRPNAATVMAALSAAVKQAAPIMHADPSKRDALQHQITQAHASLKAGNLDKAQGFIAALQGQFGPFGSVGSVQAGGMQGSEKATENTASGVAAGHASAQAAAGTHLEPDPLLAKAAQVWDATCSKVRSELHRVEDAFVAAVGGHGVGDQLSRAFNDMVQPVHHALDGALGHKLHEVNGAKDHAARTKVAGEAKVMIAGHRKSIAEHPVLHAIESNPLVPVSLRKLIHAGLDTAEKMLGKHLTTPPGGPGGTAAGSIGGAAGRAAGSAHSGEMT